MRCANDVRRHRAGPGENVRTVDRLAGRGTLKAHAAPTGSRLRIEFETADVEKLQKEMDALELK